MRCRLKESEQETIIRFSRGEEEAAVFTYEKSWQVHFEKKLKLKPTMDNGAGGKEYKVRKEWIDKPKPVAVELLQKMKRTKGGTTS